MQYESAFHHLRRAGPRESPGESPGAIPPTFPFEHFPELGRLRLSQQIGWSHFVEIIPIDDPLKRQYYAEMCRAEQWSVRTLRAKIQGMMFERTALSKKPAKLIKASVSDK
jgi:hypothetical protein